MTVRNAPSALPTLLRFIGSRVAHRARGSRYRPPSDFRLRAERTLAQLGAAVSRCDWLHLAPLAQPWIDTGIALAPDRAVSLLASGMLYASRALDVGVEPKVGLWYRIGEGEIAKIVGNASSFAAGARGGRLYLTCKPPGEFADRRGAFDASVPRAGIDGGFDVAVIQWRDDGLAALRAAAQLEPTLFGPALARRLTPKMPPTGWRYLWRLGQGEIFTPAPHDAAGLCCETHGDVGILQFPVDRPFDDSSTVSWSWCVERLPSTLPEHIEPTHDYLSFAVEFDNGLDLTWMWSCALPVDTVFRCPLVWWKERETHWVVRSGTAQLGQWLAERRSIAADYRAAIGGELPRRIVAVWLIANSVFQRGEGKCVYRDITLQDAEGSIPIAAV